MLSDKSQDNYHKGHSTTCKETSAEWSAKGFISVMADYSNQWKSVHFLLDIIILRKG